MKIRHAYDLNQLLCIKQISDFFNSGDFTQMLLKVGKDDLASYRSNNQWLKNHPVEALIFKDIEAVWEAIKEVYENEFRVMVFGDEFPAAEIILQTLQLIKSRLSTIDWTISFADEIN